MRKLIAAAMVAGTVLVAGQAEAQSVLPLTVEVRGGVGFPMGDFGDGTDPGAGFGASLSYQVIPFISIYGGYDWYSYGSSDVSNADLTDSGFAIGGKIALPVAGLVSVNPWVKAGAIFHTLELESAGTTLESDRSTGFEVGVGASFPLGLVVSVTPGLVYRSYDPDFGGSGGDNVSTLAAEIGLSINL